MSSYVNPALIQTHPGPGHAAQPGIDALVAASQQLSNLITIPPAPPGYCARLLTYKDDRKEAVNITWDKPVVVGRNASLCDYVVSDSVVSNVHFKIYAVRTYHGNAIISCQVGAVTIPRRIPDVLLEDFSTNGVVLNGVRIRKESLILMDGDELQIPRSQSFTCQIPGSRRRVKTDIFEPSQILESQDYKTMGPYRISSNALGSGSYGKVYLAMDMERKRQVACKTIRISARGSATSPVDVMKEVNILKSLRHPNINCVWDIEHREDFTYLFLELSTGGDLDMYIRKRGSIPEDEAKFLSYQLMKGLYYLHELHIAHRDLKPENILLHEAGSFPRVIIADFGLARPRAFEETFRVAGTISYLPPEAITALNCKHIGGIHPFDYEMGTLDPSASLASAISEELIEKRIVGGELDFPAPTWTHLREARSLICKLLVHNPRQRLTIAGAVNTVWILADYDELETLYWKKTKDVHLVEEQ
ncbi:kinase-like protein [Auricularia subglabra TFB-10046 SS5]|nr:kinase-like protein [Auricularia subglabra TFB-10046 SS5]